jgi:hypothetical protein
MLLFICNNRRISSSIYKNRKESFWFLQRRTVPFRHSGPNLSWPQASPSFKSEKPTVLCVLVIFIYTRWGKSFHLPKKKSKQILNQNYYRIEPKSSGLIPFPCTDSSNTGKPSCSCFVSWRGEKKRAGIPRRSHAWRRHSSRFSTSSPDFGRE